MEAETCLFDLKTAWPRLDSHLLCLCFYYIFADIFECYDCYNPIDDSNDQGDYSMVSHIVPDEVCIQNGAHRIVAIKTRSGQARRVIGASESQILGNDSNYLEF